MGARQFARGPAVGSPADPCVGSPADPPPSALPRTRASPEAGSTADPRPRLRRGQIDVVASGVVV